jgi:hypothetical protein
VHAVTAFRAGERLLDTIEGVLVALQANATGGGERRPRPRRGCPPNPRVHARNEILRELHAGIRRRNNWAELAKIANEDPRIKELNLQRKITRDIARDAIIPSKRRKRRGSKSRN